MTNRDVKPGPLTRDYEVWQNGEWCASSSNRADAEHYLAVYGQEGPVEAKTNFTYAYDGFHDAPPEAPADQGVPAVELARQIDILRRASAVPVPDDDADFDIEKARRGASSWRLIAGNVVAAWDAEQGSSADDAVGCAEKEVGRAVYERIETLIGGNSAELDYLTDLVASVEEYGSYSGPPADQGSSLRDTQPGTSFQSRVLPWLMECFGAEIAADRVERCDRFIEEALELAQSLDWPKERAFALVDYVYGRPAGEPFQEVGGTMVTLAALCQAAGLDMDANGETELARIMQPEIVQKIRAKQAAKPTGSALPVAQGSQPSASVPGEGHGTGVVARLEKAEAELRRLRDAEWSDHSDEELGRCFKAFAEQVERQSGKQWSGDAEMRLGLMNMGLQQAIKMAAESNAETFTYTAKGFHSAGVKLGDWRVVIERVPPPPAASVSMGTSRKASEPKDEPQTALPGSVEVEEKDASDAPCWYSADEANAWASGFNAAIATATRNSGDEG